MSNSQTLESAKYWEAWIKQQNRQNLRLKQDDSATSFMVYAVAQLMMGLVFISYLWMPVWIEKLPNFL